LTTEPTSVALLRMPGSHRGSASRIAAVANFTGAAAPRSRSSLRLYDQSLER